MRTWTDDSQDLQLEKFFISEAIRLPLHSFDLVVGAFKRSSRDGIIIIGENPGPMRSKRFGKFLISIVMPEARAFTIHRP
jgi:hypothetical protein